MADTEQCPHCKNWFSVTEGRMGVPGGRERETIACPHCKRTVREATTDGFWYTDPAEPPSR
jgi:predicted Zn finger-like uncharacterized protein